MGPKRFDTGVFITLFEQHTQDGQTAFAVFVDKVSHHGRGFAVDLLFAGAVKVELHQLKGLAVYAQLAAWRHVDLDGVAVVDDFQRSVFVVRRHIEQGFFKRAFDVQRRLRLAPGAGRKVIAPGFRPHGAFVTPVHCMLFITCFAAVRARFSGRPFIRRLARTFALRQDIDFFARRGKRILGGANHLLAARPVGAFQGLFKGLDGGWVLAAFGEQTNRTQTHLAIGGE